jgi:hypothetical protein
VYCASQLPKSATEAAHIVGAGFEVFSQICQLSHCDGQEVSTPELHAEPQSALVAEKLPQSGPPLPEMFWHRCVHASTPC